MAPQFSAGFYVLCRNLPYYCHMVNETLRKDILNQVEKRLGKRSEQKKFIDTFFQAALTNPKSFAHQRMVDIILPADTVEQIDNKRAEEINKDVSLQEFRIHQALYDKQKEVIDCVGQFRNIMCLTSRRCGKSVIDGAIGVWAALQSSTPVLYLNITFTQAIRQIIPEIERFAKVANIKIVKEDKNEGLIVFENGSTIQIGSNVNKASADKYRGFKYKVIIIDEIGHMNNLDYLLDEVLYPAQTDFERPTLIMTGTPSRIPHHFSTELFLNEENGIKKFNWSMVDNPFLPNPRQAIEEVCKRKGITIDDPFIQREYFGKFVADTEALVVPKRTYHAGKSFNYDGIVIGVDYGYTDSNSIVAVGWNEKAKKAETVAEVKFNRATVTEVMNRIEGVYNSCVKQTQNHDNVMIYCDTNEQSITADLRIKRKLPAFNCYKYNKQYALELIRDMCGTGDLLIEENGILDVEFSQTLYQRDDEDNIIPEIDDEIFHPDAIFALLYSMRRVFHELDYDIQWKETSEELQWKYKKVSDENGVKLAENSAAEEYGISLVD